MPEAAALGRDFIRALEDAGVIESGTVRRVVVDAHFNGIVLLFVESVATERILHVVPTLTGVEIRSDPE